jgi:hypothetical protein
LAADLDTLSEAASPGHFLAVSERSTHGQTIGGALADGAADREEIRMARTGLAEYVHDAGGYTQY